MFARVSLALALALVAPMASAQCGSKAGTIAAIDPLTDAWKVYNSQLIQNSAIDEKVANRTAEYTAKRAAIVQQNVDRQAALIADRDASTNDINNLYDGRLAALLTKLTTRQQALNAKFDQKIAEVNTLAGQFNAEADAYIAEVQANATVFASANSAKLTKIQTKAADKKAALSTRLTARLDAINAATAQSHISIDAREATIAARYAAKETEEVNDLATRYATIDQDLEATKYDIAASLAAFDAHAAYPADCLIDGDDAVASVKTDASRNSIWNEHINGVTP